MIYQKTPNTPYLYSRGTAMSHLFWSLNACGLDNTVNVMLNYSDLLLPFLTLYLSAFVGKMDIVRPQLPCNGDWFNHLLQISLNSHLTNVSLKSINLLNQIIHNPLFP